MKIDEIKEALKDIKNQLPSNSMSRRISSTVGLKPNTLLILIKLAEDVCKGNYIHKKHILNKQGIITALVQFIKDKVNDNVEYRTNNRLVFPNYKRFYLDEIAKYLIKVGGIKSNKSNLTPEDKIKITANNLKKIKKIANDINDKFDKKS